MKMINTISCKHLLSVVLTVLLMTLTVSHVHAMDLDAVLKAAETALSTPEARAQQEEDMRQFVAFQVRSFSSDYSYIHSRTGV